MHTSASAPDRPPPPPPHRLGPPRTGALASVLSGRPNRSPSRGRQAGRAGRKSADRRDRRRPPPPAAPWRAPGSWP